MKTELKVEHLINDTYQVVEYDYSDEANDSTEECLFYTQTVRYQGTISGCNAYIGFDDLG